MKAKTFILPPFSPRLYVVIGKVKGKKLRKHVKKKFKVDIPNIESEVEESSGCCNMGEDLIVLWLPALETFEDIATLTHECLHATAFLLNFSSVPFTESSEEVYAYYIAWMVKSVLEWYPHGG